MRISLSTADRLIDAVAERLNAGVLAIYQGSPLVDPNDVPFMDALVTIPFQSPAFQPAENGRALAHELPSTPIAMTGEAGWAQLLTASGDVVADVAVRAADSDDAEDGDVLVDRTDFHRGGLCTLTRVTLTIPLQC